MELEEAKEKFIQAWGTLGSKWGINRTMAQVHALLMVAPDPLSAEDIMQELNISRGNANMNIRALIDWGIVEKELKPGERKEFFVAEKDMWEVTKRIVAERRKRELEPVLKVLNQIKEVEGENSTDKKEFTKMIKEIERFAQKADKSLDKVTRVDEHWFLGTLMKVMK
jgi:DNA-binding transcriptional regulator GbsR (MarR family)